MTPIQLRTATAADATAIAALHAASWRAHYRGVFLDTYLDGPVFAERALVWQQRMTAPVPNQFVLVAEHDLGLAGFVCAFGAAHAEYGTYIDNLHVKPGLTGHGVGAMLLRQVAAWAATRSPERGMYLSVLAANTAARRFYERYGAQLDRIAAWEPPGGGSVDQARYVWSSAAVRALCAE